MNVGLTEAQMWDFISVLNARVSQRESESAQEVLTAEPFPKTRSSRQTFRGSFYLVRQRDGELDDVRLRLRHVQMPCQPLREHAGLAPLPDSLGPVPARQRQHLALVHPPPVVDRLELPVQLVDPADRGA